MKQNDHFINILNRFYTASQTNDDIDFMNKFCLKPPPMDNILPNLFYTNLKTTTHNKIVHDKTLGETFKFFAKDVHFEACYFHFKLSLLPFHTFGFHHELFL
jgi:hypothetical protein